MGFPPLGQFCAGADSAVDDSTVDIDGRARWDGAGAVIRAVGEPPVEALMFIVEGVAEPRATYVFVECAVAKNSESIVYAWCVTIDFDVGAMANS